MTTSQINNTIDYLVKTISWAEIHPSLDLFINIRHKLNELRQEVDDAIRSEVTATLIELVSTGRHTRTGLRPDGDPLAHFKKALTTM